MQKQCCSIYLIPLIIKQEQESHVKCHVSHVTCHLSHNTFQVFFFDKVVKLVSGESVINGAYPV